MFKSYNRSLNMSSQVFGLQGDQGRPPTFIHNCLINQGVIAKQTGLQPSLTPFMGLLCLNLTFLTLFNFGYIITELEDKTG